MIIKRIGLFAYIALILLLVVLPLNDEKASFLSDTYVVKLRLDYLSHVILFLPFLLLIRLAYPEAQVAWIILLGILFSLFCEGIQYVLPYRSFNINDLLANLIGIVLGFTLAFPYIMRIVERRNK